MGGLDRFAEGPQTANGFPLRRPNCGARAQESGRGLGLATLLEDESSQFDRVGHPASAANLGEEGEELTHQVAGALLICSQHGGLRPPHECHDEDASQTEGSGDGYCLGGKRSGSLRLAGQRRHWCQRGKRVHTQRRTRLILHASLD